MAVPLYPTDVDADTYLKDMAERMAKADEQTVRYIELIGKKCWWWR